MKDEDGIDDSYDKRRVAHLERSCRNCRWLADIEINQLSDNECRYNPPVIPRERGFRRWPKVELSEWCSKWKRRIHE